MIRIIIFSILISLGFIALAQKPSGNPPEVSPNGANSQKPGQNPGPGAQVQAQAPGNPTEGPEKDRRDPFKGPQYLINKIRAATISSNPPPPRGIDDRIDAVIRWPLAEYNLVGIMWDVRSPKALVKDPLGKIHVLKIHDKLSSDEAQIRNIREGSLVVEVRGVEQIIRIKKR